jgi:hypothetical protein
VGPTFTTFIKFGNLNLPSTVTSGSHISKATLKVYV